MSDKNESKSQMKRHLHNRCAEKLREKDKEIAILKAKLAEANEMDAVIAQNDAMYKLKVAREASGLLRDSLRAVFEYCKDNGSIETPEMRYILKDKGTLGASNTIKLDSVEHTGERND